MPDGLHVEIEGLAKVQAGLRVAPREMKRELRKSHLRLAREGRGWARAGAQAGTPMERHMAGGIGSAANSTSAAITIRNTRSAPGAQGAFYGSTRYPQFHKRWVGKSWAFPSRTQGPQPLGSVFVQHESQADAMFLDGQFTAVVRVFPRSAR